VTRHPIRDKYDPRSDRCGAHTRLPQLPAKPTRHDHRLGLTAEQWQEKERRRNGGANPTVDARRASTRSPSPGFGDSHANRAIRSLRLSRRKCGEGTILAIADGDANSRKTVMCVLSEDWDEM
jgi:hypothetical protein